MNNEMSFLYLYLTGSSFHKPTEKNNVYDADYTWNGSSWNLVSLKIGDVDENNRTTNYAYASPSSGMHTSKRQCDISTAIIACGYTNGTYKYGKWKGTPCPVPYYKLNASQRQAVDNYRNTHITAQWTYEVTGGWASGRGSYKIKSDMEGPIQHFTGGGATVYVYSLTDTTTTAQTASPLIANEASDFEGLGHENCYYQFGSGAPKMPISHYLSSTVTFNANGGSLSGSGSITANPGESKTAPSASRTGYTMQGWYSAASGGSRLAGNGSVYTQPQASGTYYAHWTVNPYTTTFNANGGQGGGNVTVYYLNNGTAPTPTRTGYTFEGWYDAASGGNKVLNAGQTWNQNFTYNRTLYAHWKVITYTLTYDYGSSSLATGKTNPSTYTIESPSFTLNNPRTTTDYTFKGWSEWKSEGNSLVSGSNPKTVTIATGNWGNRKYTAQWNQIGYSTSYSFDKSKNDFMATFTVSADTSEISQIAVSTNKSASVSELTWQDLKSNPKLTVSATQSATYYIYLKDKYGETPAPKTMNLDRTAPEITNITLPATDSINFTANAQVTATDVGGAGVAKYAIAEHGADISTKWTSWQDSSSILTKKNATYDIYVTDFAGNVTKKVITLLPAEKNSADYFFKPSLYYNPTDMGYTVTADVDSGNKLTAGVASEDQDLSDNEIIRYTASWKNPSLTNETFRVTAIVPADTEFYGLEDNGNAVKISPVKGTSGYTYADAAGTVKVDGKKSVTWTVTLKPGEEKTLSLLVKTIVNTKEGAKIVLESGMHLRNVSFQEYYNDGAYGDRCDITKQAPEFDVASQQFDHSKLMVADTWYQTTDKNGIKWNYKVDENGDIAYLYTESDVSALVDETGCLHIPGELDVKTPSGESGKEGLRVRGIGSGNPDKPVIPADFTGCTSISFPSTLTTIRDNAFYGMQAKASVTITAPVSLIGAKAFYSTNMTDLTILDADGAEIGYRAFANNKNLSSISMKGSGNIGIEAFSGDSEKTLEMTGIYAVSGKAFKDNTRVEKLYVPEGTTFLQNASDGTGTGTMTTGENFRGMTGLKELEFACKDVPAYAFKGCTGLTTVIYDETVQTVDKDWNGRNESSKDRDVYVKSASTKFTFNADGTSSSLGQDDDKNADITVYVYDEDGIADNNIETDSGVVTANASSMAQTAETTPRTGTAKSVTIKLYNQNTENFTQYYAKTVHGDLNDMSGIAAYYDGTLLNNVPSDEGTTAAETTKLDKSRMIVRAMFGDVYGQLIESDSFYVLRTSDYKALSNGGNLNAANTKALEPVTAEDTDISDGDNYGTIDATVIYFGQDNVYTASVPVRVESYTKTKNIAYTYDNFASIVNGIRSLDATVSELNKTKADLTTANDELQKQINGINQQIAALQEEYNKLADKGSEEAKEILRQIQELETKKSQLKSKDAEIAELQKENQDIQDKLTAAYNSYALLKKDYDSLSDDQKKICDQLEKEIEAYQKAADELAAAVAKNKEIQSLLDAAEKSLKDKQDEYDKLKKENAEKLAAMQSEIDKAKQDVADAEDELRKRQLQIADLEKAISKNQSEIDDLNSQIKALGDSEEAAKKAYEDRINELTGSIDDYQKKIDALENDAEALVKEYNEKLQALKNEKAAAETALEKAKSDLADAKKDLEALKKEAADLKKKIDDGTATEAEKERYTELVEKLIPEKEKEIEQLEADISGYEKKIADLENQIKDLQANDPSKTVEEREAALQARIDELTELLKEKQAKIDDLQTKIDKAQADLDEMTTRYNAMTDEEKASDEGKALYDEIIAKQKDLDDLRSQKSALEDEVAALKKEIAELKSVDPTKDAAALKEEYEKKLEDLKRQLENAKSTDPSQTDDELIASIKKRIQELEDELAAKNTELETAKSDLATAVADLKALQDEAAALKDKIDAGTATDAEKERYTELVEKLIPAKEAEVADLTKKVSDLEATIEELQNQIKDLNAANPEGKTDEERTKALEDRIKELQSELAEKQKRLDELNEAIGSDVYSDKDIADMKDQKSTDEDRVKELEKLIEELEQKDPDHIYETIEKLIVEKQNQVVEDTAKLDELQNELNALKAQYDAMTDEEKASDEGKALKDKIDSKQADVDALQKKIDELNDEIALLKIRDIGKDGENLEAAKEAYQNKISELENKIANLETQLETMQQQLTDAENDKAADEARIKELETSIQSEKDYISDLNNQLDKKQKEYDALSDDDKNGEKGEKLQSQIDDLKDQIAEHKNNLDNYTKEKSSLETSVAELTNTIKDLIDKIAAAKEEKLEAEYMKKLVEALNPSKTEEEKIAALNSLLTEVSTEKSNAEQSLENKNTEINTLKSAIETDKTQHATVAKQESDARAAADEQLPALKEALNTAANELSDAQSVVAEKYDETIEAATEAKDDADEFSDTVLLPYETYQSLVEDQAAYNEMTDKTSDEAVALKEQIEDERKMLVNEYTGKTGNTYPSAIDQAETAIDTWVEKLTALKESDADNAEKYQGRIDKLNAAKTDLDNARTAVNDNNDTALASAFTSYRDTNDVVAYATSVSSDAQSALDSAYEAQEKAVEDDATVKAAQEKYDAAKKAVDDLYKTADEYKAQLDAIDADLAEKNKQLVQDEADTKYLEKEIAFLDDMTDRINGIKSVGSGLSDDDKAALEQYKKELADKQAEIDDLQKKIDSDKYTDAEIEAMKKEKAGLESQILSLEEEIKNLKTYLAAATGNQAEIDALNARIAELEARQRRYEAAKDAIEQVDNTMKDIDDEKSALQKQYDAMTDDEKASDEGKALKARIQELEDKNEDLERALNNLKAIEYDLQNAYSNLDALQKKYDAMTEAEKASEEGQKLAKQIEDAKQDVADKEAHADQLINLTIEFKNLIEEGERLQKEYDALSDEDKAGTKGQELLDKIRENKQKQDEVKDKLDKVETLTAELDAAKERLRELQKQYDELEEQGIEERAKLAKEIKDLEAEIANYRAQLAENGTLKQTIQNLTDQINGYQSDIDKLQAQLDAYNKDHNGEAIGWTGTDKDGNAVVYINGEAYKYDSKNPHAVDGKTGFTGYDNDGSGSFEFYVDLEGIHVVSATDDCSVRPGLYQKTLAEAISDAQKELDDVKTKYEEIQKQLEEANKKLEEAGNNSSGTMTDEQKQELKDLQDQVKDLISKNNDINTKYQALKDKIANGTATEADKKELEDLLSQLEDLQKQLAAAQQKVVEYQTKYVNGSGSNSGSSTSTADQATLDAIKKLLEEQSKSTSADTAATSGVLKALGASDEADALSKISKLYDRIDTLKDARDDYKSELSDLQSYVSTLDSDINGLSAQNAKLRQQNTAAAATTAAVQPTTKASVNTGSGNSSSGSTSGSGSSTKKTKASTEETSPVETTEAPQVGEIGEFTNDGETEMSTDEILNPFTTPAEDETSTEIVNETHNAVGGPNETDAEQNTKKSFNPVAILGAIAALAAAVAAFLFIRRKSADKVSDDDLDDDDGDDLMDDNMPETDTQSEDSLDDLGGIDDDLDN